MTLHSRMTDMRAQAESAEQGKAQLRARLSQDLARTIDIFRNMDTSGDGVIDAQEFARGLVQLGIRFDAADAKAEKKAAAK